MPFLETRDIRLHYREAGGGEPLLLIHGLGSSGADWAFQEGPLAEHFRVLMPDLRGCGLSSRGSGRLSIAQFAIDLWEFLDQLQTTRVHLLGYSLGGAVALEMALRRPDSVIRLMTINSLPSYRVDTWRKWLEVNAQIALVRVLGLRRTAQLVSRRLFPLPHQAPMRARVVKVLGDLDRHAYLETARALAGWCALTRMHQMSAPMLMLGAEHDYTPAAEKRAYARQFGAQFALVRGSRHGTPFDAIRACNACALAHFLGQPLPSEDILVIDAQALAPHAPPPGFDEREALELELSES